VKAAAIALFILLPFLTTAAVASPEPEPKKPPKPTYLMSMPEAPQARLTTKWAFVVDTSHSITNFGLFNGILKAFVEATARPTDQLKFCLYAFNNQGCFTYRKWDLMPARVDQRGKVTKEWKQIVDWLYANTGTMSFGGGAINAALRQKTKDLTVIVVSDGGFTEGGDAIKGIIKAAQEWRVKQGYGEAIITTIGIENMACVPNYPKPTNATCQGWMRDIGKTGYGGYFYVYEKPKEEKKKKKKEAPKKEK